MSSVPASSSLVSAATLTQAKRTLRTWMNRRPELSMPPFLSGGLPMLGHTMTFGQDPVGLLQRGWDEHGEVFTFNLMGTPAVAMIGPEANEAFFRAPDEILSPKEAYRLMTPVFGKGIAYDAEPEIMDQQLAFLYPALKKSSLERYASLMASEAESYFDRWGNEGDFDVNDFGNELTMYASTRSLLGSEFRSKLDTHFAELYHHLDASLTPLAYFFPYAPIPRFIRRDRARKQLVKLFEDIVESRRRNGGEDDLLQALIDARYKDGRALTLDEITGLIITIVFAGHHTSGALSAWTVVEMLRHKDHLPTLRDEMQTLHGARGVQTFKSLAGAEHLERFIMETERLHPPIIVMMRKALEEFSYRHFRIPAGTMMVTTPSVSHVLPHVFQNPLVFDPSRFAEPRAEHKTHPYNMISFGGGKHRCIGLHFAYLQIKAIFSVMLRRFDLQLLGEPGSYEPNYDFLLVGPKKPARMRYRRIAD